MAGYADLRRADSPLFRALFGVHENRDAPGAFETKLRAHGLIG